MCVAEMQQCRITILLWMILMSLKGSVLVRVRQDGSNSIITVSEWLRSLEHLCPFEYLRTPLSFKSLLYPRSLGHLRDQNQVTAISGFQIVGKKDEQIGVYTCVIEVAYTISSHFILFLVRIQSNGYCLTQAILPCVSRKKGRIHFNGQMMSLSLGECII